MSCPVQSGRSATRGSGALQDRRRRAVVVELEPEELAVVGRGLDVTELLDEADGLVRLRCRRVAGRRQQVAEQRQGLRLWCDLGRPTQARDRGVRTTFEGVDPGEAEQRGEILGTRRQRVRERGPRQGGVPRQAGVLPHRVRVERRIRGSVGKRRCSGSAGQCERARRVPGDRHETGVADGHARTADRGQPLEVGARVVDPAKLELGVEPRGQRARVGRVLANQGVGGHECRLEVVEREQDRGFERPSGHVGRLDPDGGPRRGQGSLMVAQVVAESAAAVEQRGEVRRADEVEGIGREVLRPGRDGSVDPLDRTRRGTAPAGTGDRRLAGRRDRGGRGRARPGRSAKRGPVR